MQDQSNRNPYSRAALYEMSYRAMMQKRVLAGHGQLAVRFGRVWVGIRSPKMRIHYSERNRLGWRVLPLGSGWRLFLRENA